MNTVSAGRAIGQTSSTAGAVFPRRRPLCAEVDLMHRPEPFLRLSQAAPLSFWSRLLFINDALFLGSRVLALFDGTPILQIFCLMALSFKWK